VRLGQQASDNKIPEQDWPLDSWVEELVAAYRGEGVDETSGLHKRILAKFGKNPDLIEYKVKTNAYKYSWALILISIPFLWLLFPLDRRYTLYDHGVFVTYSIASISLLLSLEMVLTAAGIMTGILPWLLLLLVPWHMYRQLRGAYALTRAAALLRLPLLYLFASICMCLFSILLVGIA
jgi:hypothetical protein